MPWSPPTRTTEPEPPRGCGLCPRLVGYRARNAERHPDWFNGAVPSIGDPEGRLLVLGLAPGVAGANRTGRPFDGDASGALLFATLGRFGLAEGTAPTGCLITNAVRCVPPGNRPTPAELGRCRPFLAARVAALPRLTVAVCLGRVAHEALVRVLGARLAEHRFAHGARHAIGNVTIFDSYHCSRYNTNTGRLTPEMFVAVFAAARAYLDDAEP